MVYSPPRSLESPVDSLPGSHKFVSLVYSLPGSRDFPVFSTQSIIYSTVFSLPGSKNFYSSVYSPPGSRFYSFELFSGLAMAFKVTIIKILTIVDYFYPLGRGP
jgi:hypothetical protein